MPTPSMRARGLATPSSSILYRPAILSLASTESRHIGIMSVENLNIIGFSDSSGSIDFTISSLSRTSLVSTSISYPYSNSSVITEVFSRDSDVICLRCSTELREFSRGLVTFCSISSALAPGYIVITMMVFVSMSGKRSIGSLTSEKRPSIITATKQSMVMIGRFTAAP